MAAKDPNRSPNTWRAALFTFRLFEELCNHRYTTRLMIRPIIPTIKVGKGKIDSGEARRTKDSQVIQIAKINKESPLTNAANTCMRWYP